MSYVYIIGDHDESGTENLQATLDRSMVIGLLDTFPYLEDSSHWIKWKEDARAGLEKLLTKTDEELAGVDSNLCHDGWGGLLLHVVKLTP